MKIEFIKMHGLGNDFVLIDCINQSLKRDLRELSRLLCERRFGIGADQMLLLYPSEAADFRMKIFNADGGEVEMCGNGIRCLAKYIWDRRLSKKKVLDIETLAGIIKPQKKNGLVRVDMGAPIFDPEKIPVRIPLTSIQDAIIDRHLKVKGKAFKITCLSMGNPHAVIVVDNTNDFPVSYYGPLIEKNAIFPMRTNVEFIEIINRNELKMRVWERGSGETLACGTGASASAVAANMKGLTEKSVTVHLLGGNLFIDWAEDDHVYMTGPAEETFRGEINI